jgi:transporter family protein
MSGDWVFWALLSAGFAAATAVLAKAGSAAVDPDLATLVRTAVVLVGLLVIVSATGKWAASGSLTARAVTFLVLSGVATGASWVCYFRALQAGEVSKVAPVDKLSVVLVAAFATVFLGERLSAREWLGVGLVSAGVLVLALKR